MTRPRRCERCERFVEGGYRRLCMSCMRFDDDQRRHRSRMRATHGDGFETFGGITPVVEFREPERDTTCGGSTSTHDTGSSSPSTSSSYDSGSSCGGSGE